MFLGIEIGGTKLQLGLGRGDGVIAAVWRGSVIASEGAAGIRRQIADALPTLLSLGKVERSQLRGIGIGFGGPTDDESQTTIKSHQIAGWDHFPLAKWAAAELGAPALICNDADTAGLGEAIYGAGKGLSPIFYMTLGSGIGGGLVVDGQIYRGAGKGATEIGHLLLQDRCKHKAQGGLVTLESIASGWGIAEHARMALAEWEMQNKAPSLLRKLPRERVTAKDVAAAANLRDPLANEILSETWARLAEAIATMVTLLCPRRVVIGGGVSLMGDLLFVPLRHLVAERTFPPFAGLTDIVPAALGEEVVLHGALALARGKFGM